MREKAISQREIRDLLNELATKLMQDISSWEDVVFIGVRSGGVLVARNIVKLIEERAGKRIPLGTLDIGLYRDDLSKRLFYPEVRRTDIPFTVEGKRVVLIDDVLNTGRSVRAAIDHIVDLGRPRRIYLMVLFDRGGRELPIQPDFVGRQVDIPEEKVLKLEAGKDETTIRDVILSGVKK